MSFIASFSAATSTRNSELATPFSAEELQGVLGVWESMFQLEDFDPDAAFDAVAEVVGDDRCEDACIILEWA